jgi:hypothetical protein
MWMYVAEPPSLNPRKIHQEIGGGGPAWLRMQRRLPLAPLDQDNDPFHVHRIPGTGTGFRDRGRACTAAALAPAANRSTR